MDGRERERTYHCEACGLTMDRGHNASLNLAALAASTTPPEVARWQHVEPTRRAGGSEAVDPARHPPVRPGPSHRKAGPPTVCSQEHTER
ncbi:hypothetical protein [Micromonospora chersina]|uniref:hypothetical protein n=1 Tax=Micromonospora chersina TaxID=47854 RepID=UPI00369345E2